VSDLLERVAGAPITWGVDESPGWGYLMDRDRVLAEMTEAGLSATELGPDGFLPTDPAAIARMATGRVLHVHLKDVDPALADKVRAGEVPFRQAVIDGLFTPLGAGGVDIEGVIRTLESEGFRGWYVLEQDVSLSTEPAPGTGPKADAVESVGYLRQLAASL